MKITFMGAGSTVFARNVIGDCLCTDSLKDSTFALYDIDSTRLRESQTILEAMNHTMGNHGKIECYLGVEQRKAALRGADFVVNAIQIGGYDPCTIIDFEIPKKYGLRQTIADTLGIGGIMRALRTIPVMDDFAKDMTEVCPDALLLNYTNPMAMLTGYMLRYTPVKTVGLCHSVQVCSPTLLKHFGMEDKLEGRRELIAGINHMAWLLELKDKNGVDLYPEIKSRVHEKMADPNFKDKVRLDYINHFGYYCTESSEHNAEYNAFYIKSKYPELIDRYNIPLDEYPRRCIRQIDAWKKEYAQMTENGVKKHKRTHEYASHIMEWRLSAEVSLIIVISTFPETINAPLRRLFPAKRGIALFAQILRPDIPYRPISQPNFIPDISVYILFLSDHRDRIDHLHHLAVGCAPHIQRLCPDHLRRPCRVNSRIVAHPEIFRGRFRLRCRQTVQIPVIQQPADSPPSHPSCTS